MKHYLQTTDDHFSRAAGGSPKAKQSRAADDDDDPANPKADARSKAKQKAKQSGAAKARTDSLRERANPTIAERNDTTRNPATTQADGVGFEAVSVSPSGSNNLRHGLREGEAKGEAVCPPALSGGAVAAATSDQAERLGFLMEAEAIPPEVAELAAVWHRMPAAVRAGIVAMVRASGG